MSAFTLLNNTILAVHATEIGTVADLDNQFDIGFSFRCVSSKHKSHFNWYGSTHIITDDNKPYYVNKQNGNKLCSSMTRLRLCLSQVRFNNYLDRNTQLLSKSLRTQYDSEYPGMLFNFVTAREWMFSNLMKQFDVIFKNIPALEDSIADVIKSPSSTSNKNGLVDDVVGNLSSVIAALKNHPVVHLDCAPDGTLLADVAHIKDLIRAIATHYANWIGDSDYGMSVAIKLFRPAGDKTKKTFRNLNDMKKYLVGMRDNGEMNTIHSFHDINGPEPIPSTPANVEELEGLDEEDIETCNGSIFRRGTRDDGSPIAVTEEMLPMFTTASFLDVSGINPFTEIVEPGYKYKAHSVFLKLAASFIGSVYYDLNMVVTSFVNIKNTPTHFVVNRVLRSRNSAAAKQDEYTEDIQREVMLQTGISNISFASAHDDGFE